MRATILVISSLIMLMAALVANAQMNTQVCPTSILQSVPAAMGAGPELQLSNLNGPDFDKEYMRSMYSLHANIAALSAYGTSTVSDATLRDLSQKIWNEQMQMNEKLAAWYPQFAGGVIPEPDYQKVVAFRDSTRGISSSEFDVAYGSALRALLDQSRDASNLAMVKATRPELRDQAKIVSRSATLESAAISRWINGGSLVLP